MRRAFVSLGLTLALASPLALAQQGSPQPKPPAPPQSANQSAAATPSRIPLTSARDLAGREVYDPQGQHVGEVEYVMIDPLTGRVRTALIGSGGFLDIGEDLTPVPWNSLRVGPGEQERVTLNTNLDKLRQGQRFSRADLQRLTEPLVITQIDNYYATPGGNQGAGSSGGAGAQGSGASSSPSGPGNPPAGQQSQGAGNQPGGQAQSGATNQGQPGGQQAQAGQSRGGQNQSGQGQASILVGQAVTTVIAPPALVSPEEIRGTTVWSRTGDDIGDIDRIMIDTQRGQVAYVLIGRGGFLGMGEEWVPVPFQALSWSPDQAGWMLNADAQQLAQMRPLAKEDLPDQVNGRDIEQLYSRFGIPPYWQRA